MGGGAFDVYCVCEEMARIDLGIATAVLATFLGSDPITVGATPEQKKIWLTRIAEEGLLFAYGATEPEAGSDLGALQTTADRVDARTATSSATRSTAASSGSATAASPTPTRSWPTRPAGPSWFVVEKGAPGLHARQARGQARHPPQQHRGAFARRRLRRCRPADRRRRRPGTDPGAGGVRLHAADGRGVRPGRAAGRRSIARSRIRPSASRPARRCRRSRATRTS